MRFNTNIRFVARVTALFMLLAALGAVALPNLSGADGSCVAVTSEAARDRADFRATAECAPTAARPDGTAAAQGYSLAAGAMFGAAHEYANGFAPVTGRSQAKVPARMPDPPPAVGSTWTNTLGAEFQWIPAGKFVMGSPADEPGRQADEVQHEVTISTGYWMGKHEVTVKEWHALMGTTADVPWTEDLPVLANPEQAREFIRKLNERESGRGYVYRLPTEAEWEYAARAGTTGARYPEYDVALYGDISIFESYPVWWLPANAWGLHGVLGSVWELVADWYGAYPTGLVTDPTGPSTGSVHVWRGGGTTPIHPPSQVRLATRFSYFTPPPGTTGYGFRLVRTMPTWTNPLGMEFAWIRTGRFQMGSPEAEKGRRRDETQHPVQLSAGYWLGTHEVTRGEWRLVMGSMPPSQPHCGSECPAGSVSWEDVQEFLRKLHVKLSRQGTRYRLPTEAEWEYAARAGTTGARYGELDRIAWYGGNNNGKLYPVGWKPANAWGLHDMLGNVWEWTADWYGAYRTYNGFAAVSPTGPRTGSLRVFRGGSIYDIAGGVRAADRRSASPRTRNDALGFRLAMTMERSAR